MKATQLRDLTAIRVEMFLRIKHPSIDPREITQVLGLQPEHATKAGLDTSAKGVKRLFSESYWLAPLSISWPDVYGTPLIKTAETSEVGKPLGFSKEDLPAVMNAPGLLPMFILAALRKLTVHKEFFARIHHEQGTTTLVVQRADHSAPFTITPAFAKRLVDFNIQLELD